MHFCSKVSDDSIGNVGVVLPFKVMIGFVLLCWECNNFSHLYDCGIVISQELGSASLPVPSKPKREPVKLQVCNIRFHHMYSTDNIK